MDSFIAGFGAGAHRADPRLKVLTAFTYDFVNAEGVYGVGVDIDQSYLGKFILTSVVKRLDVGVYTFARSLARGGCGPAGISGSTCATAECGSGSSVRSYLPSSAAN